MIKVYSMYRQYQTLLIFDVFEKTSTHSGDKSLKYNDVKISETFNDNYCIEINETPTTGMYTSSIEITCYSNSRSC